ncbi:MAG TPA: AMP-binding protein, partial [Mesotoga infera]|nr:AMP-binding protein [Mesotoga infera]
IQRVVCLVNELIHNGQFNIGHICTKQQCDHGLQEKVAMRFISQALERTDYTFGDIERNSNRFANALLELGLSEGDIVFSFLPKTPEQFFSFLGILKIKAIAGTLFSSFGEDALLDRLGDSKARCLITRKSSMKKINRIRDRLPELKHIILIDVPGHESPDILSYSQLTQNASDVYDVPQTGPETPSVLHYTSGSTGKPKGVLHLHRSVLHQNSTSKEILNLADKDIYWCTADQGWVTGTSYGIIGPWSLGVTQVHFAGGYDPALWFEILQREKITVWYTAPTALRMLMQQSDDFFADYDLSSLKYIFSVGEPLNPEIVHWSRRVLKKEIYDTWFQTETGGIMISNRPGFTVKPGSMGKPVGSVEAAIIEDGGTVLTEGKRGNLCLKLGWPSMFSTYINKREAYESKFKNGFYYSGDTAYTDGDGYYWFTGRSDDVINTAGHLISPFEIESALLEIPEIAESGVIGAPDDLLFEKVVAFVALKEQCEWTRDLELKIRIKVSNKVSTIATPQEIIVVDSVPKNKSGKIMRRVLKAIYKGEDPGDLSTMED